MASPPALKAPGLGLMAWIAWRLSEETNSRLTGFVEVQNLLFCGPDDLYLSIALEAHRVRVLKPYLGLEKGGKTYIEDPGESL